MQELLPTMQRSRVPDLTCLSFPPDYSEKQPSLQVSHMSHLTLCGYPQTLLEPCCWQALPSPSSSCTVAQPWHSTSTCHSKHLSTCCLHSPPLLSSFLSILHKKYLEAPQPLNNHLKKGEVTGFVVKTAKCN